MNTLYDSSGRAHSYVDDGGEHIYTYSGTPVAYIRDDAVYGFNGRYLGWIQNGWFYDTRGRPAFFTEGASGGPVRPVRAVRPVRGVRAVRPVKSVRQVRPVRSMRPSSWSSLSGDGYFEQ